MPAEEMYPVSELAEAWRCSPDFIYDLISRGELRSMNLSTGRAKTRVPASAVEEYQKRQTRTPLRSAA